MKDIILSLIQEQRGLSEGSDSEEEGLFIMPILCNTSPQEKKNFLNAEDPCVLQKDDTPEANGPRNMSIEPQ